MMIQQTIRMLGCAAIAAAALFVASCAAEVLPSPTDVEADTEDLKLDRCAVVRCAAGTHCVAGSCIPDEPKVFCGGIAAFPCPGAGKCIDDPSDDCAPPTGADCGGMCVCPRAGICPVGSHWDASPGVCACVANEKVFCGGIAGFPCPGAGQCVDDPSDDCAPPTGADCGGMCICPRVGVCPSGSHWDPSPGVCACVRGGSCGGNTCAAGQFCCNASCGICAPIGGACIQVVCDAVQ